MSNKIPVSNPLDKGPSDDTGENGSGTDTQHAHQKEGDVLLVGGAYSELEFQRLVDGMQGIETAPLGDRRVLVGMNEKVLRDGEEIPPYLWEPFLGGELTDLWNEVLVDEGDSIMIHGSTILHMNYGKWVIDTDTKQIPADLRADLDVVTISDNVSQRFLDSKRNVSRGRLASTFKVGGVEIGVISQDRWKEMNLQALADLRTWADSLTDPDLRESFINRTNIVTENLRAADSIEAQVYTKLFPHESMGVILSRNEQGGLTARVVDPVGQLEYSERIKHKKIDMHVKLGLDAQKAYDNTGVVPNWFQQIPSSTEYEGYSGYAVNEGVQQLIMEAFLYTDREITFSDSKVPGMALESISRVIKNIEADVHVAGFSKDALSRFLEGPPPELFYPALYHVAEKLSKGFKLISIDPDTPLTIGDKKYTDLHAWMRDKTQYAFARASATNPARALEAICINLPLSGYLSADLWEGIYREFHEKVQSPDPCSDFFWEGEVLNRFETNKLTAGARAVISANNYRIIAEHVYGERYIEMSHPDISDTTSAREKYRTMGREPENMSEVVALLLVSSWWDPDKDGEKIQKIVDGWEPSGELNLSWRVSEKPFNVSLSKDQIVEKMRYFRKVVAELLEEQAR